MPTLQTLHAPPSRVTPHQQALYTQLRHATAMAGGLEAIATQAIDTGELTGEQLDYIAHLSTHLTEHLNALAYGVAERPDQG